MPREIKSLHEALKSISFDTWVVLDLDNTVMESMLEVGGDQWFSSIFKHIIGNGYSKEIAIDIYHEVQAYIKMKSVEPEIVKVIRALQDIGIPVIALTARNYDIRHSTIRQLNEIGINFNNSGIVKPEGLAFSKGIIFCDGKNKGEALRDFLIKSQIRPKHITMLDDKGSYLEQVERILEGSRIRFDGLRYGFLDHKVTGFNVELARVQLAHLKRSLSPRVQGLIDDLNLGHAEAERSAHESPFRHGFFDRAHPKHVLFNQRREAERGSSADAATVSMH